MNGILKKVVATSTPREIVALVKAIILPKSEIIDIINALTPRQAHPGESPGQAFRRFVTRDPDGIELNQLMQAMPGSQVVVAKFRRSPQTKRIRKVENLKRHRAGARGKTHLPAARREA